MATTITVRDWLPAMRPIRVTFDTGPYSSVTRPQLSKIITTGWPLTPDRLLSKKRRVAWWYIKWCIRRGRIRAAIPEAAFAAEVLPNADRISLLLAVGTPKAASPPPIREVRRALIQAAFRLGFRALRGARISYGELVGVQTSQWAQDDNFPITERQKRFFKFIRHFGDYPQEALRNLGEKLSAAHGLASRNSHKAQAAAMNNVSLDRFLWREGMAAEEQTQLQHPSVEAFRDVTRRLFADWADFDMVAAHYAYGFDLMCTEDKGKPRSDSIFGAPYASDLSGQFGVKTISLMGLAAHCWQCFQFPLQTWR
jgi:hypothetical protein